MPILWQYYSIFSPYKGTILLFYMTTILPIVTTLLTILLPHCYFVTKLWTILQSVMAKACDETHAITWDLCEIKTLADKYLSSVEINSIKSGKIAHKGACLLSDKRWAALRRYTPVCLCILYVGMPM